MNDEDKSNEFETLSSKKMMKTLRFLDLQNTLIVAVCFNENPHKDSLAHNLSFLQEKTKEFLTTNYHAIQRAQVNPLLLDYVNM